MKKIGICTYCFQPIYGEKGSIDVAHKLGVEYVDFFTNPYYVSNPDSIYSKTDDEIIEHFSDIRRYAEQYGISFYQTHGRMRIFLNEPELNRLCLENARRDLLAARALGAKVCVMHGVTTSTMGVAASPKVMRESSFNTFLKILEWAREYDVKIASETFGFTDACDHLEFFADAKEFKDIYDRIVAVEDFSKYFSICVDTGHSNTAVRYGNPTPADVIRMFGKGVSCLHLHDNDGLHDQHLPLYSGTIDWNDVFDALDSVGFDGVYNLEVNFKRYGRGFEIEAADFAVKLLRFALSNR